MGLNRRISLFVGSGLLVCLVTFGLLGVHAVNEATNRELQERLLLASVSAGQIDRTLAGMMHSLEVADTAMLLDPSSSREATERGLRQIAHAINPQPSRLLLYGAQATPLAAEPADESLLANSASEATQAVLRSGKAIVATSGGPPDSRMVSLIAPIRDRSGAVVGAVRAEYERSPDLFGFLRSVQLGQTGEVQVVDAQGNLISAVSGPDDAASEVVDRERYASLVQRGAPYVGVCHECHAGPSGAVRRQDVVAFAPLGNAPWGIVLRQSADEAFATANELRGQMIGFGLLLLLAGLGLAAVTTRSVVKPIEQLTGAAQRIARGDLASPIAMVGHGEIAVLASTFDTMREQVRGCMVEIEGWNETLENRVLQRTREITALLQMANTLTSTLDLDTLLDLTVRRSAETFKPATAGALLLYDRSRDQLIARSSVGFEVEPLQAVFLHAGEGIPGRVFGLGQELRCNTSAEIETAMAGLSASNRRQLALAAGQLGTLRSCICAPLVAHNHRIGCLFLVSPQPEAFSESDLKLLRAIADQAAVAVENAQLYEEVRRSEEARGELVAKLISAQEEERRRLARELHDETSQALTALVMSLARLRKATPAELAAVHGGISEMESLAGSTLDEIHRLVHDLRPTLLDDLGLVPALQWYLETHSENSGLKLDLRLEGMEDRLPPQVETVLYRVIQEATTNVARHAQARSATIQLSRKGQVVIAVVEDDGRGFDARVITRQRNELGLGILGMKERVHLLGGRFNINTRPGRGTKLTIEVPIPSKEREYDSSAVGGRSYDRA